MQYYIFKPACDTKETGPQYPQVQKMKPGYDYKAFNSVHALSRETKALPDYGPNLDYFILHNQAKPTDLLSVTPVSGGFMVSEKLQAILQQFNLPLHKFYPAKVLHKDTVYDYYWLHIICNLTDVVDYPKSTFFVYKDFTHNLGNIHIGSKEDLIEKRKQLKADNPGKTVTIWSEKIFFMTSFKNQTDLFAIGLFDANYYITEPLKEKLLSEKITGIELHSTKIFE